MNETYRNCLTYEKSEVRVKLQRNMFMKIRKISYIVLNTTKYFRCHSTSAAKSSLTSKSTRVISLFTKVNVSDFGCCSTFTPLINRDSVSFVLSLKVFSPNQIGLLNSVPPKHKQQTSGYCKNICRFNHHRILGKQHERIPRGVLRWFWPPGKKRWMPIYWWLLEATMNKLFDQSMMVFSQMKQEGPKNEHNIWTSRGKKTTQKKLHLENEWFLASQ